MPVTLEEVVIRSTILKSMGDDIYIEDHPTLTDLQGYFAIYIGMGSAVSGEFDRIGWRNNHNRLMKRISIYTA